MSQYAIGRRQLVRTAAGVAAGGVLVGAAGVGQASAATDEGLLGSWWLHHRDNPPGPPNPGIAVVSFAAGGVAMTNDIRPAGTLGTGAWSSHEDGFRATYWAVLPLDPNAPPGSLRIKARGSRHGDAISGTFRVTGFDASGTQVFTGSGTFSGTRMSA